MADPSYDSTLPTAEDKVRLVISDIGGQGGSDFLFKNGEITGFLDLRDGNVMRAAALALITIASNRVQVAQRISYLNLDTSGDAEAKALRLLAQDLEEKADMSTSSAIEFADFVSSGFRP